VGRPAQLRAEELEPRFEALKELHKPKSQPGPRDWLARHSEDGQSFQEYQRAGPVRPSAERHTIDVQPLGEMSPKQREILAMAADYVQRYFQVPVRMLEPIPASAVPAGARRRNSYTGEPQILTTFVLDELLAPRVGDDSLALIALTAEDLYPDQDWNFVFGQASFTKRVGVWSMHRYGDPASSADAFELCLRRVLKTAVHELGHMLGIAHCIAYECVMNGSNHLEESDSRPMEPCPPDLQKLAWNTGLDPAKRFADLAAFWRARPGAGELVGRLERSAELVRQP